MNKLDLLNKILHKEPVDRLPAGFWFHFLENEAVNGSDGQYLQRLIDGHHAYIEQTDPDLIKIMTDGFFLYNDNIFARASRAEDLYRLEPLPLDDKWYDLQLELASKVMSPYKNEIPFFYNLFSFANTFRFSTRGYLDKMLVNLYRLDKKAFANANAVVSHDLATLAERLVREAGVTGVYLSVRNTQDLHKHEYKQDVLVQEQEILNKAHAAGGKTILHICGYDGFTNDLQVYADFKADIINYATHIEQVPLKKAREIFKDSVLLGGFDNTADGILYKGSEDEIYRYTRELMADFGGDFILGADCTVPRDLNLDHIKAVKRAAVK